MAKRIRREDVIQAVRIAARDAANTSPNAIYVKALRLAVRALEDNAWTMPKWRIEGAREANKLGEDTSMLIPGTVLVSDCCKAIVTMTDDYYECSKCQQECTASQSLSEAVAQGEM